MHNVKESAEHVKECVKYVKAGKLKYKKNM